MMLSMALAPFAWAVGMLAGLIQVQWMARRSRHEPHAPVR